MDIYQARTMLLFLEHMLPMGTFLLDRYFPFRERDVFETETVLANYREGNQDIAPFVAPRKGDVPILRDGYRTESLRPANIAPSAPLTTDDLQRIGHREIPFMGSKTQSQRAQTILGEDMDQLRSMVLRRMEWMAAQVMFENGLTMRHIADDKQAGDDYDLFFYDGVNEAVYTNALGDWTDPAVDKIEDLYNMAFMLTSQGLSAVDLVCSPEVGNQFIRDKLAMKFADNRRFEDVVAVNPHARSVPGVGYVATVKTIAAQIDIYTYTATYRDLDGVTKPYIPKGMAVMTAPRAGRRLHGATTTFNENGGADTHAGAFIPRIEIANNKKVRSLIVESRPLLIPRNKNCFIAAQLMPAV